MVKTLKDTGERMVPEFHKGSLIYAEHITRYAPATQLAKGKVVLDIASGSGYGTKMLAKEAKKVYGVDVSEDAVEYARDNFGAANIEYKVGDGEHIPLPDNSIDLAITFETIEHIKDYKQFISEINRVLKPDGLAIVSTPNDLEFAEGNHFHLHEFTEDELTKLLKPYFKNMKPYFQGTWKYVMLGDAKLLSQEGNQMLDTHNFAPLDPKNYLYFYLLCSNRTITEELRPMAALGEHYSDRALNAERAEVQQLRETIKSLEKHNSHLQQLAVLEREELESIKASQAYKVATRLAEVKHKVSGHPKD